MAQQPVIKTNNTPAARKAAAKERRQTGKEALRAAREKDAMKAAANAAKHQEEWDLKMKIAQAAKDKKAGDTKLKSPNMKPDTRGDMTFAMQGDEQDLYAGIAEQLAKKRTPSPVCADEVKDPHIPTIPINPSAPLDLPSSSNDAALSPPSNDFDHRALQARRAIEEHSKGISDALINENAKSMALVKRPLFPETFSIKSEKFDWADEVEDSLSSSNSNSIANDEANPDEEAKPAVDSNSNSERQSSPEGTSETISPDTSIMSDEAAGQAIPADEKIGRCIAGTSKLYSSGSPAKALRDNDASLDLVASANSHGHCCSGDHPANGIGPLGRPNSNLVVARASVIETNTNEEPEASPGLGKTTPVSTPDALDTPDNFKQTEAVTIEDADVPMPAGNTINTSIEASAGSTQLPVVPETSKPLSNKQKTRAKKLRAKARKAAEQSEHEASTPEGGSPKSESPSTASKSSSVKSDDSPVEPVQEAKKVTVGKKASGIQLAVIPKFPPGWPHDVNAWNAVAKPSTVKLPKPINGLSTVDAGNNATVPPCEPRGIAANTVKTGSAPSSPSSPKSWAQVLVSPPSTSGSEGKSVKPAKGSARSKTSSKSGNSSDRAELSSAAKIPKAKQSPRSMEPVVKIKEGSQKGKKQLKKMTRKDAAPVQRGLYNEVLEEDTNVVKVKGMKMDDVKGEIPRIMTPEILEASNTVDDAVLQNLTSSAPATDSQMPAVETMVNSTAGGEVDSSESPKSSDFTESCDTIKDLEIDDSTPLPSLLEPSNTTAVAFGDGTEASTSEIAGPLQSSITTEKIDIETPTSPMPPTESPVDMAALTVDTPKLKNKKGKKHSKKSKKTAQKEDTNASSEEAQEGANGVNNTELTHAIASHTATHTDRIFDIEDENTPPSPPASTSEVVMDVTDVSAPEPDTSEELGQEDGKESIETGPAQVNPSNPVAPHDNPVEMEGHDVPVSTLATGSETAIDVSNVSSPEPDTPGENVQEEVQDFGSTEYPGTDVPNTDLPTDDHVEAEHDDIPSSPMSMQPDAVIDVSNVSSAEPATIKDEELSQDPNDASVIGTEKNLWDTQHGDPAPIVASPEPAVDSDEDPSQPPENTADAENESEEIQNEDMEGTTGGDEEAVTETRDQTDMADLDEPSADSKKTSTPSDEPASGVKQQSNDIGNGHDEESTDDDSPHPDPQAQTSPSEADDEASASASASDSEASTLILAPPAHDADPSTSDREHHLKELLEELGWKIVMRGNEGGEEYLGLRRAKGE